VVIFDIIMVTCNVSCAKNQGLAFRPTHHRASALDLLSLTGKGADSDLAEAFTCQDIPCCRANVKSRVVTKTCHEDGAFLVG